MARIRRGNLTEKPNELYKTPLHYDANNLVFGQGLTPDFFAINTISLASIAVKFYFSPYLKIPLIKKKQGLY